MTAVAWLVVGGLALVLVAGVCAALNGPARAYDAAQARARRPQGNLLCRRCASVRCHHVRPDAQDVRTWSARRDVADALEPGGALDQRHAPGTGRHRSAVRR